MKKAIKSGAALLLCLIFCLTGCGKTSQTEIAKDGTVGHGSWGATVEEFTKDMKDGSYELKEGDITHVTTSDTLYGCAVELDYQFYKLDDSPVLEYILITPENADDIDTITGKITELFGEKETEGYMDSGDTYQLTEENQYWHSEKSVAELLTESETQTLLDEGYTSAKLSMAYPVMISETEDTSGNPAIMINGLYSVYIAEWQE